MVMVMRKTGEKRRERWRASDTEIRLPNPNCEEGVKAMHD
jgi:hypothetical protein